MKSKFIGLVLSGVALSLGLGSVLFTPKKSVETQGYSTSSLPTTIDLNDTSAENIRSYYSSLNNLDTSERQGTNLLKNLKTILKNGQKYYSYDSGNAIWQIYEIADRDWEKSPAENTTYGTYNSTTKKITGYSYGTSSSNSKNNPYIHALYINRNVTNQTTAWDDHQQTQWGINREHVWPKAEGFEESGAGGARGDPMHLMAGNGYSNNIHSNYYYGYVNTSSSYTNCGTKYSNQSGNLLGKSKTLGGSTNVFEPQDCDKGDIARAIFYMVARYNYLSGSDSDGIDSNNPNLTLTQSLSDWSSTGYSSTSSKTGKMGVLTDLLAWHHADPVDSYEIHRNNLLYTNYTNNRNPFIDFPEWVDYIWGTASYTGTTYKSYSSTPTGYATPSSDTINGYNSGGQSTISVTSVSLNESSISIEAGSDETLVATVNPSNATNQNVTWTTSDPTVATVSGGIVHGVSTGNATITVSTSDGNKTATCSVTVTASSGQQETGYSSVTIKPNDTFSPALPTTSGTVNTSDTAHTDTTAGIAFKEQNIYKGTSAGYIMFVEDKGFIYNTSDLGTIDKVSVAYSSQSSTTGKVGVYFGTSQVSTHITSSNTTIKGPSQTDVFTNNTEGKGYFQLSTSNRNVQITQISIDYHVGTPKVLTGITLDTSDVQTNFVLDSVFEYGGLSVTAFYDDETSDVVTGYTVSSPDMTTLGEKTVTVQYTEGSNTVSSSYTITVVGESNEIITTFIVENYATDNSWSNGTQYLTANADEIITLTASYTLNNPNHTANTGKYYTYGYEWRFYQTDNGEISISAASNYLIDSVTINYNIANTGVLKDTSENVVISGEAQVVNNQSVTYFVGNSESATNGQAKITSINVVYHFVSDVPMSSISASSVRTFYVGETITNSDITVKGNNGHIVDAFSFTNSGYKFTYEDSISGGDIAYKTFTDSISYESFTTNLVVKVARKNHEHPVETITHTSKEFSALASSYTTNQNITVDGIDFTVDGYIYNGRVSLSQSYNSAPGQIVNTTPYSSGIRNVLITGASPDIQVSRNGSTWVDLVSATPDTTDYFYLKIFYKETEQSSYVNISQIQVLIKTDENAQNVANYIMFSDTEDQCTSKFDTAEDLFESMPKAQRVLFMESNDYVISTARTRFEAWARHLGKTITLSNGDYVISNVKNNVLSSLINNENNNAIIVALMVFLVGSVSVAGYFFVKRRKEIK